MTLVDEVYAVKNLEGEEGEPVHVGGNKHTSLRNPSQEVNIQSMDEDLGWWDVCGNGVRRFSHIQEQRKKTKQENLPGTKLQDVGHFDLLLWEVTWHGDMYE